MRYNILINKLINCAPWYIRISFSCGDNTRELNTNVEIQTISVVGHSNVIDKWYILNFKVGYSKN